MMEPWTVLNIATQALVVVLMLTMVGVMLWRTETWTWFGRGLMVLFLLFAAGYLIALLRLVGVYPSRWVVVVLQGLFVLNAGVILGSLVAYPWPGAPARFDWRQLLGLPERRKDASHE